MEYIEDCMTLLESLEVDRITPVDEIHPIEDLGISAVEQINIEVQKERDCSKRWTIIEGKHQKYVVILYVLNLFTDTTPFNNLPLGILPSQAYTSNPVLPLLPALLRD